MQDQEQQLLSLSQDLLDSIEQQDWEKYAKLCDPTITCFEDEAENQLVAGMQFHKFYFDLEPSKITRQSTIASPHVRVMGNAAVVCYTRLVQKCLPDGSCPTVCVNETRVWELQNGEWKHVHFHRS